MKTGLEIAVIGLAGRFPGAGDIDEFWSNLRNGMEAISFFSDDELRGEGIDPSLINNPNYVKAAGIVEDIEYFDAFFFGYTPKEAEVMDPQMRVFHQCVWHALEDAGYNPATYQGLIGLYAGAAPNIGWQARAILSGKHSEIGNLSANQLIQKDYLPLLISYKFNLKGPSFGLNTACSTSLVAIHLACQAILNGECDIALTGGITIFSIHGRSGYMYQDGMIFSQDGHCKAFSAGSKGIISSDGAGVVVLKRLEDAIMDRDHIYAVIKGSAINNDGIRKAGFTAPSVEGEAEVIKMALQMAEVEPETIDYIETHGTGTELGDPVEIEGVTLAFNTNKKGFCALGAVKSNLGHTDCAAGVAGFIKTILALKNRLIPPTLHFEIPNPHIDFINSPFYINPIPLRWEQKEYPRRAGVSSFGIGGTNAHIILEESPQPIDNQPSSVIDKNSNDGEYRLILLSAKTAAALDRMKINLAQYLKKNPYINFADAAYTLQVGRRSFNHRWMVVCTDGKDAIEALNSPGVGETQEISFEEEVSVSENTEPVLDKNMQRSSLTGVGRLWLHGHKPDWNGLYSREHRRRIPLPTYPFERQRYWIEADALKKGAESLKLPPQSNRQEDMSDWFYLPTWKLTTLESQNGNDFLTNHKYCWLVFVNELPIWQPLVQQLMEYQQAVVLVKAGNEFQSVERGNKHYTYTLNPQDNTHYDFLFKELAARGLHPEKIVHGWNVTGENHHRFEANGECFGQVQYLGFYSLLNLAKTLGKQDFSRDIYIYAITDHLQDVIGGEVLQPDKSTVLGLLKVIPQEYPGIRCRGIDIDMPKGEGIPNAAPIDALLTEFSIDSTDTTIAYRNNRRWVQMFDFLHLEQPREEQMGLRKNGAYLVTGGLGNIGLMFAELLVKEVGARLILTGRSFFPPKHEWSQWSETHDPGDSISLKIKKLREIEALGGEVLYIQADSAHYRQMKEAIIQAEEAFGKIAGVIHAAGVIEGESMRSLQELSEDDCRAQFQAKVYGTKILEELLKEKDLDFCWLLSSISCVLGGLGFGAYASANTFMDFFAKRHNQLNGTRWFSLNWDGMAADKSIAIFRRMLPLKKIDQLVVSREGALHDRIDKWVKLESLNKEYSGATIEAEPSLYPRPNLSTNYIAPQTPTEKNITKIWQNLLGFDSIGVRDDFLELGGDSLKAITAISRIQQELKVNIPISEFFTQPTVEGIARYISSQSAQGTFVPIEPTEKKEYYALSPAQKRLYIIHNLDKDNLSYNISKVVVLEGELNCQEIDETFGMLIQRHESLRTSFDIFEKEPIQRVHDEVEFCIEYNRLAGNDENYKLLDGNSRQIPNLKPLDQKERGDHHLSSLVRQFIRPFNLAQVPLLRVGLIKIHDEIHILMLDMHHIISDGVSLDILVKDNMLLFSRKQLLPLKIQYKDFSEWLNKEQQQKENKIQEEYWLKIFKNNIPELHIPMDFERPAVQGGEGDTVSFKIDEKQAGKLKKMAIDQDVTLFMILTAVYIIFLSRLTGQEDITIGTGTAGRGHAELVSIIGMFVNTLALRNFPAKEKPFTIFLKEVKENTLLAFRNQDYPFEELVKKVLPNRNWKQNPLFNTIIVSNNITIETDISHEVELPKLKVKPYPVHRKFSSFDIGLLYVEMGNELLLTIEYSTKLFKKETIEKFVTFFKEILSTVIENHDVKLENIIISHEFMRAQPQKTAMELNI